MELTIWTYEGPPHVGAMRIATAMKGVHYVLHAPQGDTYADLLFTMIERRDHRPPVTYTTFQAQDLGGDTAEIVKEAVRSAHDRFRPQAMLVGESCTAELIQDNPGGLAATLGLDVPIVPLELPSYQRKENFGASEAFYHLVRALAGPHAPAPDAPKPARPEGRRPRCNILGGTALGFRHRDDIREIRGLLEQVGVEINVSAPLDATPADLARMGEADFNVVLYPEIADTTARWLERTFHQPRTTTVPIGVGATRDFLREVAELSGLDPEPMQAHLDSRLPWYSRSVDSNYLTGKRVFIFGDATHALAAARVAREEMGFEVVGLGCYNREFARDVRKAAKEIGLKALITDDYLEVEDAIREAAPEMVLGTQMERHIAKRLGLFCTVISAPVHVEDFPARYSPQMGPEGANVLFDTWVHPLMMGLEEHLLGMFQDDFEFGNDTTPSHLRAQSPDRTGQAATGPGGHGPGGHGPGGNGQAGTSRPGAGQGAGQAAAPSLEPAPGHVGTAAPEAAPAPAAAQAPVHAGPEAAPAGEASGEPSPSLRWLDDAERELKKIPFFVRGKARRNTERFATEQGIHEIDVDTLYDAKAHFGSR
ncbi:MAG: ferredoxin:protochlorophyllide reductase (ATP-dependent) subunit B [Gemmatimonadales bacterium]|nr:MAG: ferredoxin:protochlorophyllide reductase (ATP-dependent) subunit B [Gemmatimonadales bacterium]